MCLQAVLASAQEPFPSPVGRCVPSLCFGRCAYKRCWRPPRSLLVGVFHRCVSIDVPTSGAGVRPGALRRRRPYRVPFGPSPVGMCVPPFPSPVGRRVPSLCFGRCAYKRCWRPPRSPSPRPLVGVFHRCVSVCVFHRSPRPLVGVFHRCVSVGVPTSGAGVRPGALPLARW